MSNFNKRKSLGFRQEALMVLYSCIFMQLLKQVFDTAYSVLLVTEAQMPFHHEEQQIRRCRLYALQHRSQPS